jgi:hypothetical protein
MFFHNFTGNILLGQGFLQFKNLKGKPEVVVLDYNPSTQQMEPGELRL